MALYKIEWKNSAKKEFKKIDAKIIPRILKTVETLRDNPYPPDCKKLVGSEAHYRIIIGDYRVIYTIFSDVLVIKIIRVAHRQDVYK